MGFVLEFVGVLRHNQNVRPLIENIGKLTQALEVAQNIIRVGDSDPGELVVDRIVTLPQTNMEIHIGPF